ncbi:MAG: hypothetical protein R3B70_27325 [Polyangiaceae bacterium]
MSAEHKPTKDTKEAPLPPHPIIEYYKQFVDRSLLRENLKLTVDERFEKMMALQRFAEELRRAGKEARKKP